MRRYLSLVSLCTSWFVLAGVTWAAEQKVLTNHLGYEATGAKHFVILGKASDSFTNCTLKDWVSDGTFLVIPARAEGAVSKWRDWYFWTGDFDSFATEGKYYLDCTSSHGSVRSFPFVIQQNLLERNTLSDAVYYFKSQRSSGRLDQLIGICHLRAAGRASLMLTAAGGTPPAITGSICRI